MVLLQEQTRAVAAQARVFLRVSRMNIVFWNHRAKELSRGPFALGQGARRSLDRVRQLTAAASSVYQNVNKFLQNSELRIEDKNERSKYVELPLFLCTCQPRAHNL